jgi:molybdenum cofactor cytidylyltransferase
LATGAAARPALEAVILAAGAGTRFGGGKLLAAWDAGVLLEGALAAAYAAPVRSVTVVIGADAEAVAAVAREFDPRTLIAHAADHAEGMGASLRTGIASLPADADGVFVFLGDMPRVPTEVLGRMAQALVDGALAAAPVFQGRRGNPVLIDRTLFPQLLALTGDAGARGVLQSLGDQLALVESPDDGVLFDVDRPEDLARLPPT